MTCRRGRVDAGEQPGQGGLAGAGRADDGEPFAGPDLEVDAVQHVAAVDVGVPHARGHQPLAGRAAVAAARSAGTDGPERAGERGEAALRLVDPVQDPVERVDRLQEVERGGGDLADGGPALGDEPAADDRVTAPGRT